MEKKKKKGQGERLDLSSGMLTPSAPLLLFPYTPPCKLTLCSKHLNHLNVTTFGEEDGPSYCYRPENDIPLGSPYPLYLPYHIPLHFAYRIELGHQEHRYDNPCLVLPQSLPGRASLAHSLW